MTQALMSPPFFSTMDNPVTGGKINFYEVKISALTQQVYPGKSKAKLVGYDGMSPGPTFYMEKGTEAVVRFINESPTDSSIHLHGSYSVREFPPSTQNSCIISDAHPPSSSQRAPWDGWAEDVIPPNQWKDYYYPNHQSARTLWYHDHAIDHVSP